MITSNEIMAEYSCICLKLRNSYPCVEFDSYIDLIASNAEFHVPVELLEAVSRDPDDDKFIAAALSANCKLIVSGDKDLLDVSGYAQIKIIKPAIFVKQFDL